MSSTALVIHLADTVQAIHGTGGVFALRLGDCEPEQRRDLIDAHGRAMQLLRKRGHRVRAGLVHDDLDGECPTLRIVSHDWQSVERLHEL